MLKSILSVETTTRASELMIGPIVKSSATIINQKIQSDNAPTGTPAANKIGLKNDIVFGVIVLLSIWVVSLAILACLHACGQQFGLRVWPMGEDRVWIDLLQNHHGTHAARAFWLINDRNPLSPWWYLAASPLILHYDCGIYLVRKLVDPALSIVTFLLINRLGRGKHAFFAFACALSVLFWNFSSYYLEQIMWNFLVALVLSLGAVYFYCRYVDNDRRDAQPLVISLLLYLLAIASYTLQCGAIIAIFAIGLMRSNTDDSPDTTHLQKNTDGVGAMHASPSGWAVRRAIAKQLHSPLKCPAPTRFLSRLGLSDTKRIWSSLRDSAFYGAVFLIYTMIWVTTSRPESSYYKLSPALFSKQLGASLQRLFWQADCGELAKRIIETWNPAILGISLLAALVIFSTLLFVVRRHLINVTISDADPKSTDKKSKQFGGATANYAANYVDWRFLSLMAALLIAVCLPTVILESTSAVWTPGTRVRMIAQFFSPCLVLLVIYYAQAIVLATLRRRSSNIFVCAAAVICAISFVLGLEYNRELTQQTAFEMRLANGLRQYILPNSNSPQYFLVRLDNVQWPCSPFLHDLFIRTALKRNNLYLRLLTKDPPLAGYEKVWRIGMANSGVKNVTFSFDRPRTPWSQVVLASFDGQAVRLINPVTKSAVAGYQVNFESSTPIMQCSERSDARSVAK